MITRETTVSGSSVLAKFCSLLFVFHMLPTSKSFSLLSSLYINTISKNDINKTINLANAVTHCEATVSTVLL